MSAKEWQQNITQDHRKHLVAKISSTLLQTIQQDNHPLLPDPITLISNYAQRIENDTFNAATSREDYFQRLAERIYRIQKEYEEKRMLKRQQMTITAIPSIDKSAGEQGPPNRIAPQCDYSTSLSTAYKQSQSDNNHHSNSTITLSRSLDQHRISTDSLSRLAIHSNSSNAHTDTNEHPTDTTRTKLEEPSSNCDGEIQVSSLIILNESRIWNCGSLYFTKEYGILTVIMRQTN